MAVVLDAATVAAHLAASAHHAITRADDGRPPLPTDDAVTAAYERHCQTAGARLIEAAYDEWRAEQLARCCPDCVPDGTGPTCDDHDEEGS